MTKVNDRILICVTEIYSVYAFSTTSYYVGRFNKLILSSVKLELFSHYKYVEHCFRFVSNRKKMSINRFLIVFSLIYLLFTLTTAHSKLFTIYFQ